MPSRPRCKAAGLAGQNVSDGLLADISQETAGRQLLEHEQIERSGGHAFPMYVLPLDTFMAMTEIRSHAELLDEGVLVQFQEDMGNALFISHQWAGHEHPDPNFEQSRVLQRALINIFSGRSKISVDVISSVFMRNVRKVTPKSLRKLPLFLWYDYFSVPQITASEEQKTRCLDLQRAIGSIPSYVERSEIFVILAPVVAFADRDELMSKNSWASRGWCRVERAAAEFYRKPVLMIESDRVQCQCCHSEVLNNLVGEGQFTIASDLDRIAPLMGYMVRKRLGSQLASADVHNYRILLNMRCVFFRNLNISKTDELLPGFEPISGSRMNLASSNFTRFMQLNGFADVLGRDSQGWTPMCYAALMGNPAVIEGLLDLRANPNDRIGNDRSDLHMAKNTPVLSVALFLQHTEAAKALIEGRADMTARDVKGITPVHHASAGNNASGLHLLAARRCDVTARDGLGYQAFQPACAWGSQQALHACLSLIPASSRDLKDCLHIAVSAHSGPRILAELLEAQADVNEAMRQPFFSPLGLVFTVLKLMNRFSPSKASSIASHCPGITPLGASIISGSFEMAMLLLANRARPDLKTCRGKTALDLALEYEAPKFLVEALERPEDESLNLVQHHLVFSV